MIELKPSPFVLVDINAPCPMYDEVGGPGHAEDIEAEHAARGGPHKGQYHLYMLFDEELIKRLLLTALWQAYYHCELDNLDTIDSNDHPRLIKLVADLEERLQSAAYEEEQPK